MLNWKLLSNPLNYIVVVGIVSVAAIFLHLLETYNGAGTPAN